MARIYWELVLLVVCGLALLGYYLSRGKTPKLVLDKPLQKMAKAAPPITQFTTITVGDVGDQLNPTELVLGVTVNGQSRAYPINMLTGPTREIINDSLGGKAIAATW